MEKESCYQMVQRMPIMKKKKSIKKKTARKYAKMSEWSLVGGIMGVKKRTSLYVLHFLNDSLCTWITSFVKEKSKNFKNAVYAVSIFIFSDGGLHFSKS